MIIWVHNSQTGQMERFERGLREPMPYANETLLVGEFRGTSQTHIMWTMSKTMTAWTTIREMWGRPIYLPYAFKRIGEGGHAPQSQHYAGTAFDCGQNLTNAGRARLRTMAAESGLFTYVEPAYLTPTWVHFDTRTLPPACATGGYPVQRRGQRGVYVCVLQDALNTTTNAKLSIDGIFGARTDDALLFFQATHGLAADGIVGCATWRTLTELAVGAGLPEA